MYTGTRENLITSRSIALLAYTSSPPAVKPGVELNRLPLAVVFIVSARLPFLGVQ